jgi:Protein of unknown function (DUF3987)
MDYFQKYLDYVGDSESPILYHRWTSLSIIGALLGREVYLPFGHSRIYPNQYIQLMGAPGTRKSTAIGIGKRILKSVGYHRFAPDRMSKERFLMEMMPPELDELDDDLMMLVMDKPSEIFVVAEEFGDFLGQGNMEFATMLTKLWDNMDSYEHPKIHGKSVVVHQPTVNILSGNTVQGLALTIPPEGLGNGFMSRLIFVFAEETGIKITFPLPPDESIGDELTEHLVEVKEKVKGAITVSNAARKTLDRMYKEFIGVEDPRLKHYGTRRFTHLLKLCIIFAAANLRTEIDEIDALRANTILHFTELKMPKALGEFGRSKYSDVANIILDGLGKAVKPMTHNELWKLVSKDLARTSELGELLKGLMAAEKIQVLTVNGKQGYMPLHTEIKEWSPELLLPNFLTEKEIL